MRAPSQRRALGALFFVLSALFVVIAVAGARAGVWPVAIASAALGAWMLGFAFRAWKPR